MPHPNESATPTPMPERLRKLTEKYPQWRDGIQDDLDAAARLTQPPIPERLRKTLAEHHPECMRLLQEDLDRAAVATQALDAETAFRQAAMAMKTRLLAFLAYARVESDAAEDDMLQAVTALRSHIDTCSLRARGLLAPHGIREIERDKELEEDLRRQWRKAQKRFEAAREKHDRMLVANEIGIIDNDNYHLQLYFDTHACGRIVALPSFP